MKECVLLFCHMAVNVDSFLNDKIEIPRTNIAGGKECPLNERFTIAA